MPHLDKTSWAMARRDLRHTGAVSYPVYDQTALRMQMYAGLTFTGNIGSTYRIEAANALSDTIRSTLPPLILMAPASAWK